jgi:hypothetical protein
VKWHGARSKPFQFNLKFKETLMINHVVAMPFILYAAPFWVATASLAFSESPDSSGSTLSLDSLARQVDSLAASLVQLKLEKQDNSIYAIGDALDWGKGFGMGMRFSEPGVAMELSYTFKALDFNKPYYLGNYRSIGLAAGYEIWVNENPMVKSRSDTTFRGLAAPYFALRFSTPVLLNFTSFSAAFRLFWTKPEVTPVPGWGISEEMQFWLTKKGHINLGFNLDGDPRLPDSQRSNWSFKPYFGVTTLFGNKGDFHMRPAK